MAIKYKNFEYTDHLVDTEIDLTEYLAKSSDTNYTLELNNLQPVKATIKNLFERKKFVEDYRERGARFEKYTIGEGELIEDIAIRYYNSEDFWWVVALFNDIEDVMTEWPMTENQLHRLKELLVAKEDKYSSSAYYNLLFEKNEEKRKINVLKREQLYDLIFQFRNNLLTEETELLRTEFTITI